MVSGQSTTFAWTRFWLPRSAEPVLADGYLYDPESKYGAAANPKAITLSPALDDRCLVLLGEPGSGKSHELERYAREEAAADAGRVLFVDFRFDRSLSDDLFREPKFLAWRNDSRPLTLIIDSLDEHPLGVHEVASQLIGQLRKGKVEQLRLRLGCRSAEYPAVLEEQLPRLFGERTMRTMRLAPLRRVDVELAGGDRARELLAAIEAVGAQALASSPITLGLLVRQFNTTASLPATRVELYRRGCELHCTESSATKSASADDESRTKARKRYQVAARIAAVCLLGGRSCMTLKGSADEGPETFALDEVLGGEETADGHRFPVGRALVVDVAKTSALFTSVSPGAIGWAHQTYCEFMAAEYLVGRGLSSEELHALLTGGGDRTVTSMRELAAWMASMDRGLFERMVSLDPEPLLSSDFAFVSDDERAHLVDALLERIDRGDAFVYSVVSAVSAGTLRHPGLAPQLERYIGSDSYEARTRLAAAYVAKLNDLSELAPILGAVALDPEADSALRETAASAIASFGDPSSKAVLHQLLSNESASDEMIGTALDALWPADLTPDELFEVLSRPRDDRTIGSYVLFISKLSESLPLRALNAALAWTTRLPLRHHLAQHDLEALLNAVMRMGWNHVGDESVRPGFAKAVFHRFLVHDGLLDGRVGPSESNTTLRGDAVRRRLLTEAMVALDGEGPYDVVKTNLRFTGLVYSDDMAWIVSQLRKATGHASRVWAMIAAQCVQYDGWTFDNANELVVTIGESDALRHALGCQSVSVCLGTAESRQMRKLWHHAKVRTRQLMKMFRHQPPTWRSRQKRLMRRAGRRVAYLLARAEAGVPDAAWQLVQVLAIDPALEQSRTEFASDLTKSPGWLNATAEQRARILSVARAFVLAHDEKSDAWLGKPVRYQPSVAGYKYVLLLLREDPDWVEDRAHVIWPAWGMMCLAEPANGGQEFERLALSRAQEHAPESVERALGVLLVHENESSGYPSSIFRFSQWSDRTARFLLQFMQNRQLKDGFLRELLRALVERRIEGAARWAANQLESRNAQTMARRLALAAVLLAFDPTAAWEVAWRELFEDDEHARQILLAVAEMIGSWRAMAGRSKPWSLRLCEAQVGALYVRAQQLFPLEDDPDVSGVHWITPREEVKEFNRSLLRDLSERGTAEALATLGRIRQLCPKVELTWQVLTAKESLAQAMWRPLAPPDVIALGTDAGARRMYSGPNSLVVLFFASEWLSSRGGLSTFNRWFCCAWARERPQDRVVCAVDKPTKADFDEALRAGVTLVHGILVAKGEPELGVAPASLADIRLDLVIGHGAISGIAAREQAGRTSSCRRVHVMHVGPDEAEYAKERPGAPPAAVRAEDKVATDIELAVTADLALAVGPRLTRELGKGVHGRGKRLIEILPALPLVQQSSGPPPGARCLILGRIDDFSLKGVDLAAMALSRLDFERLPCRPELYVRGEAAGACDETKRRLEELAPGVTVVVRPYTPDEDVIHADIRSASVLVMPSRAEAFGLVALEAIAAGVPVLVSDRSGFGEMLQERMPEFAPYFVVPVTDDTQATARRWAEALEPTLRQPPIAFERARKLREALAKALQWGPIIRDVASQVSAGRSP